MFSFLSKKKEELFLVIEIRSDIVKAVILKRKDSNNELENVFSISKNIERREHTSGSHLIKMMFKAVSQIALEISHKNNHFKSVHYILDSPWVVSHSKTVNIDFKVDTEITDKYINDIVDKDYKKLIDFSGINDSNRDIKDLICIEHKIFNVKFNGYPVVVYQGKKTKKLEISFASTLGSSHVLKKTHTVLSHFLHIKSVEYHSSSLLIFTSLRTVNENFIALNIHGELTDVIVSSGGLCRYTGSFPYGVSTMLRKFEKAAKNSNNINESSISLLYAQKLDIPEEKRIRGILEPIVEGWYSGLQKAIKEVKEKSHIPNLLYISSSGHQQAFINALSSKKENSFEIVPYDNFSMYILSLKKML